LKKHRMSKLLGILIVTILVGLYFIPGVQGLMTLPDEISLNSGKQQIYDFKLPVDVKISGDDIGVLKFNGTTLKEKNYYSLNEPITIEPNKSGDTDFTVNLFGFLPLKDIKVSVSDKTLLIPGGQSIGVTLYTRGALIVGTSDISDEDGEFVNPASEAGLLPGDVIEKINGVTIENADHLSRLITDLNGDTVNVSARRDNRLMEFSVQPVKDSHDGKYRLGVWVRDSTAGVGTLTFYDPVRNIFAGLGHAVTDLDTGKLLTVKDGEIIESEILEIAKGEKGQPGELKGTFDLSEKKLGRIEVNSEFGIYGKAYKAIRNPSYPSPIPVGTQEEVQYGPAKILCTIDDQGIKEYDCQIVKINRQKFPAQKGLVIQITDPELLRRTGGIVQGMSGSPILQNGKIIGAVTHVFISSPEKGYGMFIEWMLNEMKSME
jgi:stage IV sporulation protein B